MNISEIIHYDKDGNVEHFSLFKKLFLSIVIILTAFLSFGIGRLSVIGKREPIRIEYDPELTTDNLQPTIKSSTPSVGQTASVINALGNESVVVSKNGTKYHYSYCSGAKQIKEENKIVFKSASEAEDAGYTLAANCSPR